MKRFYAQTNPKRIKFNDPTILITEKSSLKIYQEKKITLLLDGCVKEIKTKLIKNPAVLVYGKPGIQHRSIGFFSDVSIGYHYSNQLMPSQKLTPQLTQLLKSVNLLLDADFNGILVNKYANGKDFIGQHCDDEKDLASIGVVTISYGAERIFRITSKLTGKLVKDINIKHGTIYHMSGDFQKEFKHGIPKQSKITQERISFTFRKHLK